MQTLTCTPSTDASRSGLIYRLEGELAELYPVGPFPEGIRFHNDFSGTDHGRPVRGWSDL